MLFRNRELRLIVITYIAVTCILSAASLFIAGGSGALWVLATAGCLALPVTVFTAARYRALRRLSTQLDDCLHGERKLDLGREREGELAILANEIDKLLQRLTITAEALERDKDLLSDALADISHQLKTPMTSMSIMIELIRTRIADSHGELAPEDITAIGKRLRTMEMLQDRMSWLVSALLKLARVDAGVITMAHEHVSVRQLIDDAVGPLAIAFDLADVSLCVSVQPDSGYTGDLAWSSEAVRNILKNCLEHTPAGGRVLIEAKNDALACRIIITDSGPGISDEDLPHIFERFYRGGGAQTASDDVDPAGVGIGLALAKSLVSAQGGHISAGNVLDPDGSIHGARFSIAFFKVVV